MPLRLISNRVYQVIIDACLNLITGRWLPENRKQPIKRTLFQSHTCTLDMTLNFTIITLTRSIHTYMKTEPAHERSGFCLVGSVSAHVCDRM